MVAQIRGYKEKAVSILLQVNSLTYALTDVHSSPGEWKSLRALVGPRLQTVTRILLMVFYSRSTANYNLPSIQGSYI